MGAANEYTKSTLGHISRRRALHRSESRTLNLVAQDAVAALPGCFQIRLFDPFAQGVRI